MKKIDEAQKEKMRVRKITYQNYIDFEQKEIVYQEINANFIFAILKNARGFYIYQSDDAFGKLVSGSTEEENDLIKTLFLVCAYEISKRYDLMTEVQAFIKSCQLEMTNLT